MCSELRFRGRAASFRVSPTFRLLALPIRALVSGPVDATLILACVLRHRPSPNDPGANADRRPERRGRGLRPCGLDELSERARSAQRAMTRAPPFPATVAGVFHVVFTELADHELASIHPPDF